MRNLLAADMVNASLVCLLKTMWGNSKVGKITDDTQDHHRRHTDSRGLWVAPEGEAAGRNLG